MAMNKKEKAYLEKLETLAALRHTDGAEKDVLPPLVSFNDEVTKGYTFNSYTKRVDESCSSCISHSKSGNTKPTSKGSISMFSDCKHLHIRRCAKNWSFGALKNLEQLIYL